MLIAIFIVSIPLILVYFENFDSGKYEKQKDIPKTPKEIEA
jgi:hypothetical protein